MSHLKPGPFGPGFFHFSRRNAPAAFAIVKGRGWMHVCMQQTASFFKFLTVNVTVTVNVIVKAKVNAIVIVTARSRASKKKQLFHEREKTCRDSGRSLCWWIQFLAPCIFLMTARVASISTMPMGRPSRPGAPRCTRMPAIR